MIEDDFESEIIQQEEKEIEGLEESTSNKFELSTFYHPLLKQNTNILNISKSKKYIYLITDKPELLLIESKSLKPILKSIPIPASKNNLIFKENLIKIWSDRIGNHNIIRYEGGIYYFNNSFSELRELKKLKNIEITAIGFDDTNTDEENTNYFLIVDYNNNIYECNIKVDNKKGCIIKENVDKISNFNYYDEYDEEDNYNFKTENITETISDIKFFRSKKSNLNINEDAYYIIAVTRDRFYQLKGPGLTGFKQLFGRYNNDPSLFNTSCNFFLV